MILLIDGYNLVKQVVKSVDISYETRLKFINELSRYSKKKNHRVVIVFDGGDFSFAAGEVVNDIQIIYSGYKDSADTVIKDYLSENSSRDILLVSSDRELRDFASKLNIDSIKALDFYDFVKKSNSEILPKKIKGDTLVYKTSEELDQDLDDLMLDASGKIDFKDEDFKTQNSTHNKRTEKYQQKVIKKFKKL